MKIKIPIFLVTVLLAVISVLASIILQLASSFTWAQEYISILILVAIGFVALQFLGPFLYRKWPDRRSRPMILQWVTYTSMGFFISVAILWAISLVVTFFLNSSLGIDVSGLTLLVFFALAVLCTLIGFAQAMLGPKVYRIPIPLSNLPAVLQGLRIVQVSDLHIGPLLGEKYCQRVADKVKDLEPDILVFTGDMVDGSVKGLRDHLRPLLDVRAKYGRFFVIGNHEFYWGGQEWFDFFKDNGVSALWNEHRVLEVEDEKIVVGGVVDVMGKEYPPHEGPSMEKAFQGAPQAAFRLALSHRPGQSLRAIDQGADLFLAGHTHAGQFYPAAWLVRRMHRFAVGLHRLVATSPPFRSMWVYVNRGTGFWGPPNRFGVPSEITCLTLLLSTPKDHRNE